MILERKPVNLCEVEEILKDIPESERKTQMDLYLKKFCKTKPETAKKIKKDLEDMDLMKLKNEHIVKIIDLLPEDASDTNKIFTDVSLTEDETNKILEIVKKHK